MRFEEHCERSEALLGERFEQVHIWLDHFAFVPSATGAPAFYDPEHRRHRHHVDGIMRVWQKWGKRAALAATRHVLDDLCGPLCNDVYQIPADEAEYSQRYLSAQ